MISKIVKKQVQFISTNANITDIYELDRIRYGLEAVYNESFKLVVMVLVALILDKLPAFFITITLLSLIRPHVGGSHSKSTFSCLIKSNTIFIGIYFIAGLFTKINILIHLLLILFVIYSVNKFDPVNPLRKKVNKSYSKIKFKTIVTLTSIIWFIFSNLFLSNYLINCGILMILYILVDFLKEVYIHEKIKQI